MESKGAPAMKPELDKAVSEARRIALRAKDWLAGKEEGSVCADPAVVMCMIEGNADKLAWMLQTMQEQECRA
jgi:hypothetical protein